MCVWCLCCVCLYIIAIVCEVLAPFSLEALVLYFLLVFGFLNFLVSHFLEEKQSLDYLFWEEIKTRFSLLYYRQNALWLCSRCLSSPRQERNIVLGASPVGSAFLALEGKDCNSGPRRKEELLKGFLFFFKKYCRLCYKEIKVTPYFLNLQKRSPLAFVWFLGVLSCQDSTVCFCSIHAFLIIQSH